MERSHGDLWDGLIIDALGAGTRELKEGSLNVFLVVMSIENMDPRAPFVEQLLQGKRCSGAIIHQQDHVGPAFLLPSTLGTLCGRRCSAQLVGSSHSDC